MSAEPSRGGSAEIADEIRKKILDRTYLPGTKIEPLREIAERWQVSRATVDRAISILRSEDLIDTDRTGTRVKTEGRTEEVVLAIEIEAGFEIASAKVFPASRAVAADLDLREGASLAVIRLRRVVESTD